MIEDSVKQELNSISNPLKAKDQMGFFQVFEGGYGAGDRFLGISVPLQRAIAKKHYGAISLDGIVNLLRSNIHEYRLTALFMLVSKYEHEKNKTEKERFVKVYLDNLDFVNNWDLVDSSAHLILGRDLFDKDRSILYTLAQSANLWHQRVAMISSYYFIKKNDFGDAFRIADQLIAHKHDLIHKAVGWMLREIGNRDFDQEYKFLESRYKIIPRTMLRYAIEKFPEDMRQKFLKGAI